MGTPAYMAPEQFVPGSTVNARNDIYSLGILLWETLYRKKPWDGLSAMQVMFTVCNPNTPTPIPTNDPPPVAGTSSCPSELVKLCRECASISPDARCSLDHVLEVLERIVSPTDTFLETCGVDTAVRRDYAALRWAPPNDLSFRHVQLSAVKAGPFFDFVTQKFLEHRFPNKTANIKRVLAVRNPMLQRQAEARMTQLESQRHNIALNARNKTTADWQSGLQYLKQRFLPRPDSRRFVNSIVSFHGTDAAAVESLCNDGLASLRTTDGGFFCGETYTAIQAPYAAKYCRRGKSNELAVLLCLSVIGNAYIVTVGDDYDHPSCPGFSKFYSSNPQTSVALPPRYDAMFVPVKSYTVRPGGSSHSPKTGNTLPYDVDYQACRSSEAEAHELVTETAQVVPIAVVYFELTNPYVPQNPSAAVKYAPPKNIVDGNAIRDLRALPMCTHIDFSGCTMLTDKVLTDSFSHLTNLEHLDVSFTLGAITDASITAIAQNCPQLQYLDVSHTDGKITDASITAIAQNCHQLQHLDVSWTNGKITDASITAIAQNCHQLQHLCVSGTSGTITDASITAIAQNCQQLQHLNVSDTGQAITDASITAIAQNCHQLQHLDVFYTNGMITDASITAIAQNCHQLQHLNVFHTNGMITDASITAIAQNCHQLQHLDVSDIRGAITDASITAIAQNSHQLQHLNVSYTCGKITDASITAIAQNCHQLQYLNVSHTDGTITDASITAIAQNCHQLQHLGVSHTRRAITDASITAIAQNCQQLQHLGVSDTDGKITDASITAIAQNCHQLQHLDVSRTDKAITDASITAIAQNCHQLQHLTVTGTRGKITDASITAIAQNCHQLQHLGVQGTGPAITDASITAIAQNSHQLQHLNVSYTCGKITDASITAIAQNCHQLEHLKVSYTCGKITDASITAIAQNCHQLQHLDVSHTDGKITDASITVIKQNCVHVRIA